MSIIWAIIIGFLVGLVAKFLMPGRDGGGFILTTVLGIVGALAATFLGQASQHLLHGPPTFLSQVNAQDVVGATHVHGGARMTTVDLDLAPPMGPGDRPTPNSVRRALGFGGHDSRNLTTRGHCADHSCLCSTRPLDSTRMRS